jgi:membrane fusion protein (multidrug efflux system)
MRPTRQIAAATICALLWTPSLRAKSSDSGPPPAVTVDSVATQDVARRDHFIGRVEAVQFVDLRARVQGYLQSIDFQEGQQVKQGDVLYVIEPDTFEAALTHAEDALQSAQATLKEAAVNLDRYQQLANHGNASRAQLDSAIAQNDTANASVLGAEADLHTAQINLGYTKIAAPISGRIGRTAFTIGNLVDTTSGALARIVQLEPIRVVFSISERDFISTISDAGGATLPQISAGFVPRLQLANGTDYPSAGKIEFVDNQVDPNTGTIALRALFSNADGILLPGETVNVTVRPAQAKVMPVVPMSAVEENKDGKFVLVVDDQNRITLRPIKATLQVGQDWAVADGLKGGETIVTEGLQKVRSGMVVNAVRASPPIAGQ